ncbi:MAG: heparan-alpha-glucosaminide N-acetyltransferase [Methanosarcinaceae archaeon]|nr:heparan-alpha-glucosaminide N-acetyltransferase [Methanosarcinaceae archaeon]
MNSKPERFWEIDFFRGLAVLFMLVFHFAYTLDFFKLLKLSLNSGPLFYIGRSSAILFILLSGIALSLSHSKQEKKELGMIAAEAKEFRKKRFWKKGFGKFLKRGLKLFSLGLFLTAVSWIFIEERYIAFGILHFFGLSSLLIYPWLSLKHGNSFSGRALSSFFLLFSSLFFLLGGLFLWKRSFRFSALLWLGFRPEAFNSLDYFPLFPWFGVLLLGLFLGKSLYPENQRLFVFPDFSKLLPVRFFCLLGRYSLLIYFLHQPLFLAVLCLGSFLDPSLFWKI